MLWWSAATDVCYVATTQDALKLTSERVHKIYVGKRGGKKSIKQAEIDAILVQECSKASTRSIDGMDDGAVLLSLSRCLVATNLNYVLTALPTGLQERCAAQRW